MSSAEAGVTYLRQYVECMFNLVLRVETKDCFCRKDT